MGFQRLLVGFAIAALLPLAPVARRAGAQETAYVPVERYDPSRNAQKDINAAVAEAQRAGKRVLVEVGGEWCSWCHTMDRFFEAHPDLLALRQQNFVMVKVNYSKENENWKLLSKYPHIPGYPHLFVLDRNGRLLRSADTSALEQGKSYSLERFLAFLRQWAPPGKREPK